MTSHAAFRYRSFISYCHEDRAAAVRLHRWLERFHVPPDIAGQRGITSLAPIFLDQRDLLPSSSLPFEIEQALSASESLIVVCSPASAASTWVNQEVVFFHRLGRGARTFCVLVKGEPIDAVPPAIFELLDEPLAADARGLRARRRGYRRLAAALLEVPLKALTSPRARTGAKKATPVHPPLSAGADLVQRRQAAEAMLLHSGAAETEVRVGIGQGLDVITTPDVPEEVRARMLQTVGESFQRLGEFDRALASLTQALSLHRQGSADDGIEIARCLHGIALALRDLDREGEALKAAEQSLVIKRRVLGETHVGTADALSLYANLLVGGGEYEQGLALAARAVDLCAVQPDGEDYAHALFDQGTLLRFAGRLDEALAILERSAQLHRDLYGRLDPRYATALNARALCLRELGELDAAIEGYEQVLHIYRRLYTEAHPETARALNNYAVALESRGEIHAAREHYELAVAQWRTTVGEDHGETLGTRHLLARLLLEAGHLDLAGRELDDIIARADAIQEGTYRVLAGHARVTRAQAYQKAGDLSQAERVARDAVQSLDSALPENHWRLVRAMRILGEILIARGAFEDAADWLSSAEKALDRHEHRVERLRIAYAKATLTRTLEGT